MMHTPRVFVWGAMVAAVLAVMLVGSTAAHVHFDERSHHHRTSDTPRNPAEVIQGFIIPHSHCDVGWLKTPSEYATQDVNRILSRTLPIVAADPSKRFIWSEIYFFKTWWDTVATAAEKKIVRELVDNKQLEFVGGGWVQNDEAVAYVGHVIDQMTLGHQFLANTLGVRPENGWQIDPFGASGLTATLWKEMGFRQLVLNRIDSRLKYEYNIEGSGEMRHDKGFEFRWQPSPTYGADGEMRVHVLDSHYDSPAQCGMEGDRWVCHGFDFEGDASTNPPITDANLEERAQLLVDIVKHRATFYRHENVLLPFGTDFRFIQPHLMFDNMDRLIAHINANVETYGVHMQYGTLYDYWEAVYFSTHWGHAYFPLRTDPAFQPYSSCWYSDELEFGDCIGYWTGFFTSWPNMKRLTRRAGSLLRTGETLHALTHQAGGNGAAALHAGDDARGMAAITSLREAVATMQHHDAITGTAKRHVNDAYMAALHEGMQLVRVEGARNLEAMLVPGGTARPAWLRLDTAVPPLTTTASTNAPLPVPVPVPLPGAVVVHNSLGWERTDLVTVCVVPPAGEDHVNVDVYDEHGTVVNRGAVSHATDLTDACQLVSVVAERVPALGSRTLFLERSAHGVVAAPRAPWVTHTDGAIELTTDAMVVTLDMTEGIGWEGDMSVTLRRHARTMRMSVRVHEYEAFGDGAYILRTAGTSRRVENTVADGMAMFVVDTEAVFTQRITDDISLSLRVVRDARHDARVEEMLELRVAARAALDREVVLVVQTDIDNKRTLYTDNGMELVHWPFAVRFGDNSTASRVAGNYYPAATTAHIEDDEVGLSVLAARSFGASSPRDGALELMLTRRTSTDDSRGVAEPLNDVSEYRDTFRLVLGRVEDIPRLRHAVQLALEYPLRVFANTHAVTRGEWHDAGVRTHLGHVALRTPLPPNVHLQTFAPRAAGSADVVVRTAHLFAQGEDMLLSAPTTVDMGAHLVHTLANVRHTTLSLNWEFERRRSDAHAAGKVHMRATLGPLRMASFLAELTPPPAAGAPVVAPTLAPSPSTSAAPGDGDEDTDDSGNRGLNAGDFGAGILLVLSLELVVVLVVVGWRRYASSVRHVPLQEDPAESPQPSAF